MRHFISDYKSNKYWFFVLLGLLCLSGLIWIGFSPFLGVYSPMTNDYLNFAKSMLDGKVLHHDLIDHKGLYNFVPYLIAVSVKRSGFGVYLIMTFVTGFVISLLWYEYMSYFDVSLLRKCFIVFLCDIFVILVVQVVRPSPIFTPDNMIMCIVLLLFWCICSDKYKELLHKHWFVLGLLFGIILWSKFILLIYFFPFYMCVVCYDLSKAKFGNLLIKHACAVLGILVATVPVVIYYTYHNSFTDLIANYFGFVSPDRSYITSYMAWCVIFFALSIISGIVKNMDIKMICLCLSMFFGCFICAGKIWSTYTTVILVVLIPVYSTYYVGKVLPKVYLILFIGVLCCGLVSSGITYHYFIKYPYSVYDIAKKYDIQNSDIMYLCVEDYGFGSWSDDGSYFYQWFPDRVMEFDRGKDIASYQIDCINDRIPKYVITYPIFYFDWDLLSILESNDYEKIEEFRPYGVFFSSDNQLTSSRLYIYERR